MNIYLTYLPEDKYFDWRIQYAGTQQHPYGRRVIHLTEGELEEIVKQYNEMMGARVPVPDEDEPDLSAVRTSRTLAWVEGELTQEELDNLRVPLFDAVVHVACSACQRWSVPAVGRLMTFYDHARMMLVIRINLEQRYDVYVADHQDQ